MVKKLAFVICIVLLGTACGSEVRRLKQTEYLRTHPGKPLTYPQGVDRPEQEKTYVIPELPKAPAQTSSEAPELMVLPPRLAGVDLSEDSEDEKKEKSGDKTGEDVPLDEGFIETAK